MAAALRMHMWIALGCVTALPIPPQPSAPLLHNLPVPPPPSAVRFNPAEPDVFATTGSDRGIALYDLRSNTPIRKLVMQVHGALVAGLCGNQAALWVGPVSLGRQLLCCGAEVAAAPALRQRPQLSTPAADQDKCDCVEPHGSLQLHG